MKAFLKIITLAATFGVAFSSASAQVTRVLVSDGQESVIFSLDDKPTVTYSAESVIFTTPSRTVEYAIESTVTVTFVDDSGVAEETAVVPTFTVADGEVKADGLVPYEVVSVFTCGGAHVVSQNADSNGQWSISTDLLPTEPLIIKTNKYAFKFIIRK